MHPCTGDMNIQVQDSAPLKVRSPVITAGPIKRQSKTWRQYPYIYYFFYLIPLFSLAVFNILISIPLQNVLWSGEVWLLWCSGPVEYGKGRFAGWGKVMQL